jgi:hypothetical protein
MPDCVFVIVIDRGRLGNWMEAMNGARVGDLFMSNSVT